MEVESARAFFAALAARGHEPRLADAVGTWEFALDDAGSWTVTVDHGALHVADGQQAPAVEKPTTRIRLREDELLRLVRGDGHENLLTALLRGALVVEGDLAFAQKLQTILPIPEEWSEAS